MVPNDDPSASTRTDPAAPRPAAARDDVFFAAVEQSGLSMIVTDPRQANNPIIFANPAFAQLTGYPVEQVLGRNCRFMQGPETDPAAIDTLRRAIRDRTKATVELLNYRRDGTPFRNALFISPVFAPDGELLYFFGSQLDVTRQRAEDSALHYSRKMEAVGQLTSGIAHDFNNLLMVIAGNLELIEKAEQPERRQRLSMRMREAVFRAQRLTGQLLAFARRQQLDHRMVDLNTLIETMAGLMQRTLGPRIRLERRLDPSLSPCFADPGQIEVALVNLLLNARDATAGSGTVTVRTEQLRLGPEAPEVVTGEVPSGEYVSLTVVDAGIGMPPEVLHRATEPFFTTKDNGPGSGLGLSTVYGFAQQSRGHLRLQSHPGQGTSARLLFPASTTPSEAQEPIRGEARILLVEPDPAARDTTTNLLEGLGYSVIRAGSASEVLALLDGGASADLLLTNIITNEGVGGVALAAEAQKRQPNLRVLLATGSGDQWTGHNPFLTVGKPFRRADLALQLRQVLMANPAA